MLNLKKWAFARLRSHLGNHIHQLHRFLLLFLLFNPNLEEEKYFIFTLKSTQPKQSQEWGQGGYHKSLHLIESSGDLEFDQDHWVCWSTPFPKLISSPLSPSPAFPLFQERAITSMRPVEPCQWGLQNPHSSHWTFTQHLTPCGWRLWWQSNATPFSIFNCFSSMQASRAPNRLHDHLFNSLSTGN